MYKYAVTGVSTFCYLQNRKKWRKRTSFNVFVTAQKNALGRKLMEKLNPNQILRDRLTCVIMHPHC